MIPKVRKRIIAKLQRIEAGSFSTDDITILFIDIRDSLDTLDDFDKTDPLYDIFNFCAHPNARRMGPTFRYTRDKLKNEVLPFIFEGGSLQATPLTLNITDSLVSMLSALSILTAGKKLKANAQKLAKCVYGILRDVPILIEDDYIESCMVIYDKNLGMPLISFKMKYIENVNQETNFTFKGNPTLNFRLV